MPFKTMKQLVILALGFFFAISAQGQTISPQTIETMGQAEVNVEPEFVFFTLEKTTPVASIAKAFECSDDFEKSVKELLAAAEWTPSELEFSPPEVSFRAPSKTSRAPQFPEPLETILRAKITFSLKDMGTPQEQRDKVAKIHEKLRIDVMAFQAKVSLPQLRVYDPSIVEKKAIQKAMEEAYPHAEATAEMLRVRIVAVQKVNVSTILWKDLNEENRSFCFTPLTCKAEVTVTYLTSPSL